VPLSGRKAEKELLMKIEDEASYRAIWTLLDGGVPVSDVVDGLADSLGGKDVAVAEVHAALVERELAELKELREAEREEVGPAKLKAAA
jgi:hypothetical protein